MTTWRQQFELARTFSDSGQHDDSSVVAVAPGENVLDAEHSDGGPDVLIWTEQRVYFGVEYDGAEWLDSVPRDPQAEAQSHIGVSDRSPRRQAS